MTDCYLNLLASKSNQLCGINYPRFHREYRKGRYSCHTPESYDREIAWIGIPNFNNRLGSLLHRLQTQQFYFLSLYIFSHLEGDKVDTTGYAFSVLSTTRRNLSKIRTDRDSRCCGSRLGKDCNTKFRICTSPTGFDGLF
jgi:hypothetical protein